MMGTALVTGAQRGIGKAVALTLAKDGFDVVVTDLRLSAELESVAAEVKALGRRCVALACDIADVAAHASLLDRAEAAIGTLTTLVNVAGVSVKIRGDLLEVAEDSYDMCQAVNTKGTFFLTQAFAKRVLVSKTSQHRSIITVTSTNATAVSVMRGEYCVSKAGASMASKLFAARLGNHGIGVYEIQPGFIDTDMIAPAKARYQALIDSGATVIARFGQPAEVGRIASTLAQGLLPYTSGQAILADGGLMSVRY
jgi:NAD(P)-dependent dehydrogenase (short-subunit alcohol dehydrogenase family)